MLFRWAVVALLPTVSAVVSVVVRVCAPFAAYLAIIRSLSYIVSLSNDTQRPISCSLRLAQPHGPLYPLQWGGRPYHRRRLLVRPFHRCLRRILALRFAGLPHGRGHRHVLRST